MRTARRAGWAIFLNGTGHVEFRGPDGQRLCVPASGHTRGYGARNRRVEMRRAGVPGVA